MDNQIENLRMSHSSVYYSQGALIIWRYYSQMISASSGILMTTTLIVILSPPE